MSDSRNYVYIRSFLASNLEVLLESLGQRRADQKIDSEDLFGAASPVALDKSIHYNRDVTPTSRLEVLLQEKEALGLYVSGNPLEDYRRLAEWAKQVSYRDDVYLVVLNKIRKIFTKKGHMMFALDLSTPEGDYEGIIFPKKAMDFSTVLQERDLFFVRGKLDQKDEKTVSKVSEDGEVQEYDELPKILIDNLVPFEQGLPGLLADDEATMSSLTFQRNTDGLDWVHLKEDPASLFSDSPHPVPPVNALENTPAGPAPVPPTPEVKPDATPVPVRLTRALGLERIKHIKTRLQRVPQPGLQPVFVEVESAAGQFKRAKGDFWLDPATIRDLQTS